MQSRVENFNVEQFSDEQTAELSGVHSMVENRIRERIIEILKKHPEGLTILDISKILGSNRNTVTKYIYELSGAGVIEYRKIGTAKLCLLTKKGEKK